MRMIDFGKLIWQFDVRYFDYSCNSSRNGQDNYSYHAIIFVYITKFPRCFCLFHPQIIAKSDSWLRSFGFYVHISERLIVLLNICSFETKLLGNKSERE